MVAKACQEETRAKKRREKEETLGEVAATHIFPHVLIDFPKCENIGS